MKTAIPALAALTPAEKLQLIEELWEELSATPEEIPVPQWQLEELDRRSAEYAKNPSSGIPWEEVKWCYLLRHLPELSDRPKRLQEKVFGKVFEIAEIAKYSPAEAAAYEDSLKIYRDLKNVIDTAYDEGKADGKVEGKAEGIEEGKLQVARRLVEIGMSAEQAAEIAGVPVALLQSNLEL